MAYICIGLHPPMALEASSCLNSIERALVFQIVIPLTGQCVGTMFSMPPKKGEAAPRQTSLNIHNTYVYVMIMHICHGKAVEYIYMKLYCI